MAQNSLSQSYLSILTSVELVSQIKLSVSVCLFVCLSVYMFYHFLRMTEYFFSESLHMDLWNIPEVVTNVKNRHLSSTSGGGILGYFCPFWGFFYIHLFLKNGLYNTFSWDFVEMILVLIWWSLQPKNPSMTLSAWVSFWVIFGLILMYVPIFLENHSIFPHEILYRCYWYTLTVPTLIFFHAMSPWSPFWCMFFFFLRIVWYFIMKFCRDICSTTVIVTAL